MSATTVVLLGTGTDVGKTHVSCALLAHARARRLRAQGYKPVATGVAPRCDDAEAHALAADLPVLAPTFAYERPVSPHLAAREEQRPVTLEPIVAQARALLETGLELLVVEGAGGLYSPLGPGLYNADLLRALAPARSVLVASDRLGVLHEVRSTLLAARSEGLAIDAVVLSTPAMPDGSTGTNARELEALGVCAVTAVFPRAGYDTMASQRAAAPLLAALRG